MSAEFDGPEMKLTPFGEWRPSRSSAASCCAVCVIRGTRTDFGMIAIWSCGNRLIVRDLPGFAYWTIVALSANAASAIVMPMSARMASSRLASGWTRPAPESERGGEVPPLDGKSEGAAAYCMACKAVISASNSSRQSKQRSKWSRTSGSASAAFLPASSNSTN